MTSKRKSQTSFLNSHGRVCYSGRGALRRLCVLLPLAMTAVSGALFAQPALSFRGITLNWPEVRLEFAVKCRGNWVRGFERMNFRVLEDSALIGDFELFCPDQPKRCPISVALVLDASGSMAGEKNSYTRIAAGEFIDAMDGVDDEATVLWFHSRDTLVQPMTSDKALLRAAVDSLPAAGTTALWDATWSAITELIRNGKGQDTCGAVIVLTDGNDNSSVRSLGELISYAISMRVRVITIGLGPDVNDKALSMLAFSTGGYYYSAKDERDLSGIYEDIFMDVAGIEKCEIIYRSDCADGTTRRVDLILKDFCGGTDTRVRYYTAPTGSDRKVFAQIAPLGGAGREGDLFIVPIYLNSALERTMFAPSRVTVRYDTAVLAYDGMGSADSCLLRDAGLQATAQGNAVVVTTSKKVLLSGSGPLFRLRFRGRMLDQSACATVNVETWEFTGGCLAAVTTSDTVCVQALEPDLKCDIDADEVRIDWDAVTGRYRPDTLRIAAAFRNEGAKRAKNLRFRLLCDPACLLPLRPASAVQAYPGEHLQPGDTAHVEWLLKALPRSESDTAQICILAECDNQPSVSCCVAFHISEADAALLCTVSAPSLTVDTMRMRYLPSPLPCTVNVRNVGGKAADSVRVFFDLPQGVSTADGGPPTALLQPGRLEPGQSGACGISLRISARGAGGIISIPVTVYSTGGRTTSCVLNLAVPPLHAPSLEDRCSVPAVLLPDTSADIYVPNPFAISVKVLNTGDRAAVLVAAALVLPPGVETMPGEALSRVFSPSTLAPAAEAELSWMVRFTRRATEPVPLVFRWTITAENTHGALLDTATAVCAGEVLPFPPNFICDLSLPGEAAADTATGRLLPNPVPARLTLMHIGSRPARLLRIEAAVEGEGARFSPATPPSRVVDRLAQPGDTLAAEWSILLERRSFRRDIAVRAWAVDDQENTTVCAGLIKVDAIPSDLVCTLASDADVVRYDEETGSYDPEFWSVHAVLTNTSKRALANVEARLNPEMSGGPWMLEATDGGDTSLTRDWPLLFAGQSKEFTWRFRLRPPIGPPERRETRFSLDISSSETESYRAACVTNLEIVPFIASRPLLQCEILALDSIRFMDSVYVPSILEAQVRIENIGNAPARDVRTFLLQNPAYTLLNRAMQEIPVIEAGDAVLLSGSTGYLLNPHPASRDRSDTLRVQVFSDNAPPAACLKRIFAQKAAAPELELQCSISADTVWNLAPGTNDPDLVRISVQIENKGDAIARDCEALLSGSLRFTLSDSSSRIRIGALHPGGKTSLHWDLLPLAFAVGGNDTISVTAQALGGYGPSLVTGVCSASIVIVPAADELLELRCSAPDSLETDAGGNSLAFEYRAVVINRGAASSLPTSIFLRTPSGVTIVGGSTADRAVPELRPGDSLMFSWTLRCTNAYGLLRICSDLVEKQGITASCCRDLRLTAGEYGMLEAACTAPDTVEADGAVFDICLTVANAGARTVENAFAVITIDPPGALTLPDGDTISFGAVPAGVLTGPFCRQAVTRAVQNVSSARITWTIMSPGVVYSSCRRNVTLKPSAGAVLALSVRTVPADTLRYDAESGKFETGESGVPGEVFLAHARVANVSDSTAREGTVALLLPDGVSFDDGEKQSKKFVKQDLPSGGDETVTWRLRPRRNRRGTELHFQARAFARNAAEVRAETRLFVQAAPRIARLSLPRDAIFRAGARLDIPVTLDPSAWGDVGSFELLIGFNSEDLAFAGVRRPASLGVGWSGPEVTLFPPATPGGRAVVSIRDSSSSLAFHRTGSGPLAHIMFDAVFGFGDEALLVRQTPLVFLNSHKTDDGREAQMRINGISSSNSQDAVFETEDGLVTISGDCLQPLRADSAAAVLHQNHPNPFNPSTWIRFTLARESRATLLVHDGLGRLLRSVEFGLLPAGTHGAFFEGTDLPAGTYRCTLVTSASSCNRMMLLIK